MAGLTSICCLAVWVSVLALVTCVPLQDTSPPLQKRGQSSIKVTHNHNPRRNGALEKYKTFVKHNLPVPEGLERVVARYKAKEAAAKKKRETSDHRDGSIPAESIEGDLEWLCPASVGTPGQQLYLDFDTGAADTWVFSTDTAESQVMGQDLYDPTKSKTATLVPNASWDVLYGDFSSSGGIVYQDTFTLGGIEMPNMTIESAQEVSSSFTDQKRMSGLVGLGWPIAIQTTPVMPSLLNFFGASLEQNLFTTDLKHNSSEGSFNFGFIDDSLHGSDIHYVDVDNSEGYWGVQMTGFALGGSNLRYEFNYPPTVIVDTGSTLFYVPDEAVDEYFKYVPGGNFSYDEYGYVLPCNSTPPDFWWEIGDAAGNRISGTIPGSYMIYAVLEDGVTCYAGVQSLGGFADLGGLFGDVFLKSGFQVWDVGGKRFGHAPKVLDTGMRHVTDPETFKLRKRVLVG